MLRVLVWFLFGCGVFLFDCVVVLLQLAFIVGPGQWILPGSTLFVRWRPHQHMYYISCSKRVSSTVPPGWATGFGTARGYIATFNVFPS